MRSVVGTGLVLLLFLLQPGGILGGGFGPPRDSLHGFHAIRHENIQTRVPTNGKLVGIRITDNGTIYYVCREAGKFVVYHLEVRPVENLKPRMQAEIARLRSKWERTHPDELLFTKEGLAEEIERKIRKFRVAVWVRNEITTEKSAPRKRGSR